MADRFQDPKIGISKVYTRTGDDGSTGLVGGQRVPKGDARIAAYGTVDELMAVIGWCRAEAPKLDALLKRIQHQLFNVGSILATLPGDVGKSQPRVTNRDVDWLEREIDDANADLAPLQSFVLPGSNELNARLHLARTVCRRAERLSVGLEGCATEARYLNRLSDALFVWARRAAKGKETLWNPNIDS